MNMKIGGGGGADEMYETSYQGLDPNYSRGMICLKTDDELTASWVQIDSRPKWLGNQLLTHYDNLGAAYFLANMGAVISLSKGNINYFKDAEAYEKPRTLTDINAVTLCELAKDLLTDWIYVYDTSWSAAHWTQCDEFTPLTEASIQKLDVLAGKHIKRNQYNFNIPDGWVRRYNEADRFWMNYRS